MKKIFTLFVMALITLCASAAKQPLPLDNLNAGWGATYDPATKTIHFEGAWKGKGWGYWSNSADYSLYDYVVVEYVANEMMVKVGIDYNDENGNKVEGVGTSATASAGETSVTVPLNPDYKQFVNQIYIQTDAEGDLVLVDAYLYKEGDVELPQTKDITKDFNGVGTVDGDGIITVSPTKEWDWKSKWYGDQDFSAFDYLVLELAEAVEFNVQVSVQTVDAPDEKGTLEAGGLKLVMPLPETKNHVKCIALQNAAIGDFKVKAVYLATEAYVNGADAEGIINVATAAPSVIRYNLAGQKTNARGLVIEGGRKIIR